MTRKHLFYLIGIAALALVVGRSLEFRRLDEKRDEERAARFSPAEYARDFWDNRLSAALDRPEAAAQMIRLFNTDMKAAIARGRTLGQSRVHAYLLQGTGRIVAVQKEGLLVSVLGDDPNPQILLCTGAYIAGNAVRDASGLIDVSSFSDTMKFNRISAEINRIVVQEVITPFLGQTPQVGMNVRFVGAAEVADEATEKTPLGERDGAEGPWHLLRVVPIRLEVAEKSEAAERGNPKFEIRNPKQIPMLQTEENPKPPAPSPSRLLPTVLPSGASVWIIGISDFEFVSDFGFRYSSFRASRSRIGLRA